MKGNLDLNARTPNCVRSIWAIIFITVAALLLAFGSGWLGIAGLAHAQEGGGQGAAPAGARGAQGLPGVPLLPPERELAMKIRAPFTLVGVGDIIIRTPMGQWTDPAFQGIVKHLRDADVTFANMEGTMLDMDNFPNPIGGGAPKGALADIKSMGIDIMGTANNHSMDGGVPGMLETQRLLNEGGIAWAGTGKNLQEARAARFLNTPKGIIGLVSTFSIDPASQPSPASTSIASYRVGDSGGTPGLNGLRVSPVYVVSAEHMADLRKLRDTVYARRGEVFAPIPPVPANEPKDQLELFGQKYKVGPKPGDMSYEMNQGDLREILRSIRAGKQYSDFVIATIHCHQGNYAFQTYTYDNDTPDFLVEFAHKAIDNGADVFIGHGVHTIRGVEIYKGKPIYYGVSNFIYQYQSSLPQNPGGELTMAEADLQPGSANAFRFNMPERFEILVGESRYENGKLVEVRIHPGDLGQDGTRSLSRMGVPMTPSPEMAKRVLEKVQRLSKVFGTDVSIENGVGVIRVSAQQSESRSSAAGGR
jgi:poly-gamma-glutamate capsule biosynthesis protein CapA/YwtB (metallophosphatase superfamily)